MKRMLSIPAGFVAAVATAHAFFMPLTTTQRVAASSVIAVVKIDAVRQSKENPLASYSDATVIEALLGTKNGEKLRIWDDLQLDGNGKEYLSSGRDPFLEPGKTYFIYLRYNPHKKLVTVQSSLDSLAVTGDLVELEQGEGFEPLKDKIQRTRDLIARSKQAEETR